MIPQPQVSVQNNSVFRIYNLPTPEYLNTTLIPYQECNLVTRFSYHTASLPSSQCDETVSIQALFEQLLSNPVKVAIVGSGCSVATEPAAELSSFYNVTQVRIK